jgi:hypothetical protein
MDKNCAPRSRAFGIRFRGNLFVACKANSKINADWFGADHSWTSDSGAGIRTRKEK